MLYWIPVITGFIPIAVVVVCYLIAANLGHVPWCNPLLDGCTSISATGRRGPESYIFRATMIPAAVMMMLYWVLNYRWLRSLGDPPRQATRIALMLGILAGGFLILYTTVLGSIGEIYRIQRRIGVSMFFFFTYLTQLIMVSRLFSLRARFPELPFGKLPQLQLGLCILL